MTTVGSRELKTHLGRYLRLVRDGAKIVVTDRGRPVAELVPISPERRATDERLRELEALGVVSCGDRSPLLPFESVQQSADAGLSEAIIESREDRF